MKKITSFALLFGVGCFSLCKAEESISPRVTDSFYPELKNGDRLWIEADLLLLHPEEDSIAMTNRKTDLFTTADVTKEDVVEPHLKWDFGYRLGLGYLFSDRKWDMVLSWTHFDTSYQQSRSTDGDIGLGMFPIWSLSEDILPYDWVAGAKMHWKLKLNMLDIDFGRSFAFGKIFFLRPFAGLRTAWIDQEIDVKYSGGIFFNGLNVLELDTTFGPDFIFMKNNFLGIGPQLGIEPQVNLGMGLRIYGAACGTMAYGFFDVHQKETYLTNVRFDRHRYPQRLRWMIDASGGIMWKTFICAKRFALTFKLGWDYHIFFDQVEFKGDDFDLVSDDRNLSLNGLALSGRFDF